MSEQRQDEPKNSEIGQTRAEESITGPVSTPFKVPADSSGVHRRGFASLTKEQRRAIASQGGKAAQLKGTAHRWDSYEAARAGRKGGIKSRGGQGAETPDERDHRRARNRGEE